MVTGDRACLLACLRARACIAPRVSVCLRVRARVCVCCFFFFFVKTLLVRLLVTCTFTNTLKFVVKDCDPSTGEPDEEGYEDEYVVSTGLCHFVLFPFPTADRIL